MLSSTHLANSFYGHVFHKGVDGNLLKQAAESILQALQHFRAPCQRLDDARIVISKHSVIQIFGYRRPSGPVAAAMRRAKKDDAGGSVIQCRYSLVPALLAVLESPAERLCHPVRRQPMNTVRRQALTSLITNPPKLCPTKIMGRCFCINIY